MTEPATLKYRVVDDPEATYRSHKAYIRKNAASYLKNYAQWGLWLVPLGFAMFVIPTQVTLSHGWGPGTLTYVLCAFMSGWLYSYSVVHQQLANARKPSEEAWDCELTDAAWVCTDRHRVSRGYPWSGIKLLFEDDDTWVISAGSNEVTVFRKPLRDGGLEEEFLNRVRTAHGDD